MAYRTSNKAGCFASLVLFVFIGLPIWAVLLLGERSCDMHSGPPCTISWGWMKLLNGLVIAAACAAAGWLASFSIRGGGDDDTTGDGR
jgi:hypothetical protein